MTNSKQKRFLKSWVINNIIAYPLAMGILHPLISHGIGGDHGVYLSLWQFILHTIAIIVFTVMLTVAQNKSLRLLNAQTKPLDGIVYMSLLVPLFFWTGYYTLFIPYDILFMTLTIGVINAIRLRSYMKQPAKWIWQCMLTYFLAAVAAIGVGFASYYAGIKDLPGLLRDTALWVMITIPAGVVTALVSKAFLKHQVREITPDRKEEQKGALRIEPVGRPAQVV